MLSYPVAIKDINKFEKANNISVNVYSVVTDTDEYEKQVQIINEDDIVQDFISEEEFNARVSRKYSEEEVDKDDEEVNEDDRQSPIDEKPSLSKQTYDFIDLTAIDEDNTDE